MVVLCAASVLSAKQEHVHYTCSIEGSSIDTVSIQFSREKDWRSSWQERGDWKQVSPTFHSAAVIHLLGQDSSGKVVGKYIGGWQGGHTNISIISNALEVLELTLSESGNRAFGHGAYFGSDIFLSCSVTIEGDQSAEAS